MSVKHKKPLLELSGLLICVLLLAWLGHSFFVVWRTHTSESAGAYGAFLQYVAAALSTVITLIYVYYTRKSLKEAQRANHLQWKQWQHALSVQPKTWFAFSGEKDEWYVFSCGAGPSGSTQYDSAPQLHCCIWNSGTQSFRVIAIRCAVRGVPSLRFDCKTPGLVIAPHSVEKVDVTKWIVALLFRFNQPQQRYEKGTVTDPQVEILCELRYQDWTSEEKMTQQFSFTGITCEGLRHLSLMTDKIG